MKRVRSEKEVVVESWYEENETTLKKMSEKLQKIMEELLDFEGIPYHSVECRVKDLKSLCHKAVKYDNPLQQITDIIGVRIIAYVESDVKNICNMIVNNFDIDESNSGDKSEELGMREVGYRSVHYISKFDKERSKLPEYKLYENRCFEVQVRTLLQHTWAEIEHDRNYKFSGVLPENIQRRFYLIAGTLELIDREFDALASDIDKYGMGVNKDSKFNDNLEKYSINGTSVKEYLEYKLKEYIDEGLNPVLGINKSSEEQIIGDLKKFGINTLKELDDMISKYKDVKLDVGTFKGALTHYMLLEDAEKYIDRCWEKGWVRTYKLDEFFKNYGIDIESLLIKYDKL